MNFRLVPATSFSTQGIMARRLIAATVVLARLAGIRQIQKNTLNKSTEY